MRTMLPPIILVALLSGCGVYSAPSGPGQGGPAPLRAAARRATTAQEIREIVARECGLFWASPQDADYWQPDMAWVEQGIAEYGRAGNFDCYRKQWDCNKQSRDLQSWLARRYAAEAQAGDPEGVAVFVRAYKAARFDHAVLCVVTGGRVRNYDPTERRWTSAGRPTYYVGD